jgi:hypothetical protein
MNHRDPGNVAREHGEDPRDQHPGKLGVSDRTLAVTTALQGGLLQLD